MDTDPQAVAFYVRMAPRRIDFSVGRVPTGAGTASHAGSAVTEASEGAHTWH